MELLTIRDETAYGQLLHEFRIPVAEAQPTVRDLITARVEAEVSRYNQRMDDYFRGLVQPEGSRRMALGFRLPRRKRIDAEKQVYIALDAFQKNRFFVLINGVQAISLEQEVRFESRPRVSFIKLTPLVGG